MDETMETMMELDDLKSAWQTLGEQLQQQSALNLQLLRERKLDKVSSRMRRLYWGKIAQILFGDCLIYFGIIWTMRYLSVPHLVACSIFVLLYGVMLVVFGGISLARISRIDYSSPVLEIQKRVGVLQRSHTIFNWLAGLPWWFLWIALFTLEVRGNLGADLFVTAPEFIVISGIVGVIGLLATLWWRRRSKDDEMVPKSLRDAKLTLDEVARFEKT